MDESDNTPKIILMRSLMNEYGMKYFDIEHEIPDLRRIEMDNDKWEHYKNVFMMPKNKQKPKNMYELNTSIVNMIKHITNPEIIKMRIIKYKGRKYCVHSFNDELIKFHIGVDRFRNPNFEGYHEDIKKRYNL